MNTPHKARIFVVEDEPASALHLETQLEFMKYQVVATVSSGEEALLQVAQTLPDLVLMDIELAGELDGIQTAGMIQEQWNISVIYLTANDDEGTLERAKITEPFGYLLKPFSDRDLYRTIEIALYKSRIEKLLRESREKYRTLVDNLQQRIFHKNRQFVYVACNHNFANDVGLTPEEVVGKNDYDLYPKELAEDFRQKDVQVFESGEALTCEAVSMQQGHEIIVHTIKTPIKDEAGNVTGLLGILWDITLQKKAEEERRQLERQLRQAQKLESIGILAGGIAHDFNNILGTMMGYTELLMEEIPRQKPEYTYLDQVYQAGERATELVQRMLTFSRAQEQQHLTPVDLSAIIEETLKMLRAMIPTSIEIRCQLQPECRPVMADSTQMHQVLVNLCINAFHAMRDRGGRLTVALEEIGADALPHPVLETASDTFVKLTIRDTGSGMTSDIQEHIFDPFFTTKEPGEGVGLGLSVVHGIISSLGGIIHVSSQPGEGSIFEAYLPGTDEAVSPLPSPAASESQTLERGLGRILLVEDEAALGQLYDIGLTRLGYQVTLCSNGQEALDLFKTNPEQFDLVFTDQMMPHVTGAQLSRELLAIRPDIPIILTTGYSDEISEDVAKTLGIRTYLKKPVKVRILLHTIRDILA
jgi:PAS domain S-box-containing protein